MEDGECIVSLGFDSQNMSLQDTIRVMDGSPEYRIGINMSFDELQKYRAIRETLIQSIRDHGDDIIHLIMVERYTPFRKIKDVYPNVDTYEDFVQACDNYLKD